MCCGGSSSSSSSTNSSSNSTNSHSNSSRSDGVRWGHTPSRRGPPLCTLSSQGLFLYFRGMYVEDVHRQERPRPYVCPVSVLSMYIHREHTPSRRGLPLCTSRTYTVANRLIEQFLLPIFSKTDFRDFQNFRPSKNLKQKWKKKLLA